MKKRALLFSVGFFSLLPLLLVSSASLLRAEDSLLKVQVLPDQTSVKVGMMFLVSVQVANSSADSSTDFWANNCSYEKHWVTDNPAVLIQPWTCEENTLEHITLGPGEVYEKSIILYVPEKDVSGPVTFRLGFKSMAEDGDVAEPLWSDPVTVSVTVPDEMKAVAPVVAATDQPGDNVTESSAAVNEIPIAAAPESVTPEVSPASVFRDPAVPVKVRPGGEFSIALASNPSTGFRWKMTLPEGEKVITFLGSEHVVSTEVMPGVPGTEVFKFKAEVPGETKADFVYERPWEPKVAPTRKIFTVLVEETL